MSVCSYCHQPELPLLQVFEGKTRWLCLVCAEILTPKQSSWRIIEDVPGPDEYVGMTVSV